MPLQLSNRKEPRHIGNSLRPDLLWVLSPFYGCVSVWSSRHLPASLAQRAPNPDCSGSRKRSVPGRVHSVSQEIWIRLCGLTTGAPNPFLTRSSVESPSKLCPYV